MPVPFVKEIKQTDKRLIRDIDVGIVGFELMLVEHTAVKIWNFPEDRLKVTGMFRGVQAVMEQTAEETAVEVVEFIITLVSPHIIQLVAQIIHIKIQKTFLLNEVTEHESVEHNRRIPLLVAVVLGLYIVVDTCYKLRKSLMLLLEPGIEILRDFLGVHGKCSLHLSAEIDNICLLVKIKCDSVDLLIDNLGIGIVVFNKHKVAFLVRAYRHHP